MAFPTIHRQPIEHPLLTGLAVALVALIAAVAVYTVAFGSSQTSVSTDLAPRAPVLDTTLGPNQDLAPVWGIERSPADVLRAESARLGPNQDLAPIWGNSDAVSSNRGPNHDLAPVWGS